MYNFGRPEHVLGSPQPIDTLYAYRLCRSNQQGNKQFNASEITIDDFFPERRFNKKEPAQQARGYSYMDRQEDYETEEENIMPPSRNIMSPMRQQHLQSGPKLRMLSQKVQEPKKQRKSKGTPFVMGELRTASIRF